MKRLSEMQKKYLVRLQEYGSLGPDWRGNGRRIAQALVDRGLARWEDEDLLVPTFEPAKSASGGRDVQGL